MVRYARHFFVNQFVFKEDDTPFYAVVLEQSEQTACCAR